MALALSFGFMLAFLFFVTELVHLGFTNEVGPIDQSLVIFSKNHASFGRKLLQSPEYGSGGDPNCQVSPPPPPPPPCSKEDISVFQSQTGLLPNGIPEFTVQIINDGRSSCTISDIHLNCGWFSSVCLINPQIFRRVDYDDCLVNDGGPLAPGQTISFQYANSFSYPLCVSSLAC